MSIAHKTRNIPLLDLFFSYIIIFIRKVFYILQCTFYIIYKKLLVCVFVALTLLSQRTEFNTFQVKKTDMNKRV